MSRSFSSAAEIEERIKAKFPVVKEKYLSTITLDDPSWFSARA